jgi:heat shock protein HslJ
MMRVMIPLLAVTLALPVSAQDAPRGFPLDKSYSAVSISGFDVQNKGLSLTVARDPKGGLRGSGSAGCNSWNASVILNNDHIDFTNIVTTKKLCPKPKMTAEEAFLTSLRSAKRWHTEGDKFIVEGDAARLLLKAAKR